jgi:hypothetical protein
MTAWSMAESITIKNAAGHVLKQPRTTGSEADIGILLAFSKVQHISINAVLVKPFYPRSMSSSVVLSDIFLLSSEPSIDNAYKGSALHAISPIQKWL